MIDIEKLSADVNIPTEKLKQFAEAYHKAMCEQSEPVAFIDVTNRKLKWAVPTSFDTLSTVAVYDDIPLYTTPQPLKRLSDKAIGDCLNKAELPTIMLNPIVVEKLDNFANAIMDKMERINK